MDTYQLTLFLLETFLLFGIPVGLILLDRKYFNKRLYILGLVFCVTLVLAVLKNWPQDTMGFTSITSYQLLWYCSALALGSILLYLADKVFIKKNQRVDFEVVLSSVALSFAQEFIFNAYYLTTASVLFGVVGGLFVLGLMFAIVHQTFERSLESFGLSFVSGIFLGTVFILIPNIYLATLVHATLNIQALKYRLPGIGPSLRQFER